MLEYVKLFSSVVLEGGGGWRNKVKEKLHGPLPPFFTMHGYASVLHGADVDDDHQSFIIIIIINKSSEEKIKRIFLQQQ